MVVQAIKRKRLERRAKYRKDKERYLQIKRYRREVIKRENAKLKQELLLLGIIDEEGNPIEEKSQNLDRMTIRKLERVMSIPKDEMRILRSSNNTIVEDVEGENDQSLAPSKFLKS